MSTIFNYVISFFYDFAYDPDNLAMSSVFLLFAGAFAFGLIAIVIRLISKIKSFALFGS